MKVTVFSSSRADSGIIGPLVGELAIHPEVQLRFLASGTHLKRKYGRTLNHEVSALGKLKIDKVRIGEFGRTAQQTGASLGRALRAYSRYLSKARPDLVFVLGDRLETLVFVIAASIANIPIAHLHGGETTLGALDENHRHAISKLSSIHFAADPESKRRILQLGENPDFVFDFGSPRADYLKNFIPLSKSQISKKLGVTLPEKFALVTMHPAIHDSPSTLKHTRELLDALRTIEDLFCVFTGTNSDPGSDEIRHLIRTHVQNYASKAHYVESLGSELYMSSMSQCSVAIGNSSSLVLEAKFLGTPTVIIGNRQLGRARESECIGADSQAISRAIKEAIRERAKPLYKPTSESVSERIVRTVLEKNPISTQKVFQEK